MSHYHWHRGRSRSAYRNVIYASELQWLGFNLGLEAAFDFSAYAIFVLSLPLMQALRRVAVIVVVDQLRMRLT